MSKENEESKDNTSEEQSEASDNSTDETTDSSNESKDTENNSSGDNEGEESKIKVGEEEYTSEELKTRIKKSNDFDAWTAKKKADKMFAREKKKQDKKEDNGDDENKTVLTEEDVDARARAIVSEELGKNSQAIIDEYGPGVVGLFSSKHKWADEDVLTEIGGKIDKARVKSKEDLITQIEATALKLYPKKFTEAIKDYARSEASRDESNIDNGDGGGGGGRSIEGRKKEIQGSVSEADIDSAMSFGQFKTRDEAKTHLLKNN